MHAPVVEAVDEGRTQTSEGEDPSRAVAGPDVTRSRATRQDQQGDGQGRNRDVLKGNRGRLHGPSPTIYGPFQSVLLARPPPAFSPTGDEHALAHATVTGPSSLLWR